MEDIQITSLGVKRSLNKFTEIESIIEYIWNGFDAKASQIKLWINFNALSGIDSIRVEDNGIGINRNKLKEKFTPFFQSEKISQMLQEKKKKNSTFHGKNGVGRLTFFKFSKDAVWETVFNDDDGKNKKYKISISDSDLTKYTVTSLEESDAPCGTSVTFDSIIADISYEELLRELKIEFCWYLALNREHFYSIQVNGEELDISDLIVTEDNGEFTIGDYSFRWTFINWNTSLNKEYSKYYFLESNGRESFKEYTTFNNKGDKFYHSLYVQSNFFDCFLFNKKDLESAQLSVFQAQNDIFKNLKLKLDKLISDRRTPYIRRYSKKIIDDLDDIQAFDYFDDNNFVDCYKKSSLQTFIQELYVIEPKIFSQLNKEQKLTFVRLLDATMNSADRDDLFKILNSVLDLNADEKATLSKLLDITPLENITRTINFLVDRLKALDYFEQMVYNYNLKANEVNDLQFMLEQNYWLFGEQYTAVAKAEDSFVALVNNHLDVLRKADGEENQSVLEQIKSNPNKLKQVDLCCVRQMPNTERIENIVVEIKHPLKKLTQAHYQQLRKYMDILTSVKEFVADNYKWIFFLVGTDIDQSLADDIENMKVKGKTGLIFEKNNYNVEIYVRTWKSIFNEYRIKYSSLYDRLKCEEAYIVKQQAKQEIKDDQLTLNVM